MPDRQVIVIQKVSIVVKHIDLWVNQISNNLVLGKELFNITRAFYGLTSASSYSNRETLQLCRLSTVCQ